jgi:HlyD family secretion protein
MRNRRTIWILVILVFVVALAIGGYYYYQKVMLPSQQTTDEQPIQTATVRRGSLVLSATGTGTIIPAKEAELGFDSVGTLTQVNGKIGDQIKAGDVLAVLESSDSEATKSQKLLSAQIAVLKAEQNLADLKAPVDNSVSIATAEASLAQAKLDLIVANNNLADLQQERKWMTGARCDGDTIAVYQTDYDNALSQYERRPSTSTLKAVNTALGNLDYCSSQYSDAEIAEAEANISVAESTAHSLEVKIQDLENQIVELQNPSPDQDAITSAELDLENAQAQLTLVQESYAQSTLTAPFDGTVIDVTAKVGDKVSASPFITLYDLGTPTLDVYVDETDLNNIGVGYEIDVTFDALPDQTFQGQIISVNPVLQRVSNVTVVSAVAQLNLDSFAKPQILPVGLNASVDIIGSKAENVLLVPVEALRDLSGGSYGVFVVESNGQLKLHVVEVGLMDYTYAEIKSGLNLGDVVSTGIVETGQ